MRRRPRNAILLGAGLGTRIRPLSYDLPKPMMPVNGIPVVERVIRMLAGWGVEEFLVNLHHNPAPLFMHVRDLALRLGVRIELSFEPTLLNTGGMLRRVRWFIDRKPFWIANTDILARLDPEPLLRAYRTGNPLAVLWMTDRAGPRTVEVSDGRVANFRSSRRGTAGTYTFCGLHLVSPRLLDFIPEKEEPFSIITAYDRAMAEGETIVAASVPRARWADLGSPEGYLAAHPRGWVSPCARAHAKAEVGRSVVWDGAKLGPHTVLSDAVVGRGVCLDRPASGIVMRADFLPDDNPLCAAIRRLGWQRGDVVIEALPPRGSDRTFTRLICGGETAMVAQNGIERAENARYASHARLLHRRGVPVPRVLFEQVADRLAVMEDAGNLSFEDAVRGWRRAMVARRYRQVLDSLLVMHAIRPRKSVALEPPFTPALYRWERELMDEHFLVGRLQLDAGTRAGIMRDLQAVARILRRSPQGLVHRDMQSSNLLVQRRGHRIIDFQGMRTGPVAYDLASLLCDPYVMLGEGMQHSLLEYYATRHPHGDAVADAFWPAAIQRLSQALGAYGRLSALPGMARFSEYIPPALKMMARALTHLDGLPHLRELVSDR